MPSRRGTGEINGCGPFCPAPEGRYRPVGHYQSLQALLPRNYGLQRPPAQSSAVQLQLKGYLLLFEQLLSQQSVQLSSMVKQLQQQFPCSDEINFKVKDASAVMQHIRQHYQAELLTINLLDGLDLIFKDWRLSLRSSNTEPLLRLNIETRADRTLLQQKISEVSALITAFDQN